ncbi:hypothetical protein PV797_02205 [Clostridiaceae bacterium M8S5]|nr:hypothetical protein PV797_02205 [Clostridiaceae bacterium M8S5]
MKKKPDCGMYDGGKIPPCSAFLSNANPIIKDGKFIFKNENRLFYFISTSPMDGRSSVSITTNLQINLPTYIIGLFLYQVQEGIINYNKKAVLHTNKNINTFIHETLRNPPKIEEDFAPTLSLVYSNGNAIAPPLNYALNLTRINYYILFIIDRLTVDPGLFFINNSFATEDCLNFFLASLHIQFPVDDDK